MDLEVGDVQVHAGDYPDRPSLYTRIEQPDELLQALEQRGIPATARLLSGGWSRPVIHPRGRRSGASRWSEMDA